MRQPGIEPGSTAWKAAMLTTIPLTLTYNPWLHSIPNLTVKEKTSKKVSLP